MTKIRCDKCGIYVEKREYETHGCIRCNLDIEESISEAKDKIIAMKRDDYPEQVRGYMKTKEVKFKTRKELYGWAAAGKPIIRGGCVFEFHPVSQRYEYSEVGSVTVMYLDFNLPLHQCTGIEEIPAKKAYAYWKFHTGSNFPAILVHFERELTLDEMQRDHDMNKGIFEYRRAEFDLEAKE